MTDYDELFWIVLVGDGCVGKSCILSRFTQDISSPKYIPTIGELFGDLSCLVVLQL